MGAGLAVLGAAGYAFLAAASSALSAADYSAVSVLWVIVYAVGPGLFFPLEQELARVVAARGAVGDGPRGVVGRIAALAGGLLLVLLTGLAAAGPWVSALLFGGDTALTVALGCNVAALALAHLARGVLGGTGQFGRYGAQLAVDGVLRAGFGVALALVGPASPAAFGFALAAAQLLSVVVTGPATALVAGSPAPWAGITAGLALLLGAALCAQVVVNVGVVVARLLAPDPALAGELLSASVLARAPLFVFASLQASLLPGLSRALAVRDAPGYARLLRRAVSTVLALGAVGTVLCVVAGRWLTRVFFDSAGALSPVDFGWLSAGTTAFMVALVLGQGVLARGWHGAQASAWAAGLAVLAAVTVAPLGVLARVEAGYLLGSLTAAGALAAVLVRRPVLPSAPAAASVPPRGTP